MAADAGIPGGSGGPPAGILVVDKPEGPTSHDVVARVRRALRTRQIGHTGTLDPMATGVLALVLGRATRLAQFLSGREKAYTARIRLGLATDTWDRTGTPVSQAAPGAVLPEALAIGQALQRHVGEHQQVPPPFSAKKIGGVRAYELARKGQDVVVRPVLVTLHSARIDAVQLPFVDLVLTCSAGFYVRALAHGLGQQLGCGACLETLRRTASGGFTLAEAVPLDEIEEAPERARERLVPLERALPDLPAVVLTQAGMQRALHGNEVGPGDWTIPCPPGDRQPASGPRFSWDPRLSCDPASAGLTPGSGSRLVVQLFDPAGQLVAIARSTRRPGILHPAVVLK